MGIVERVEILKDGASALYGSDAIAGVVNVIAGAGGAAGACANATPTATTLAHTIKQPVFTMRIESPLGSVGPCTPSGASRPHRTHMGRR